MNIKVNAGVFEAFNFVEENKINERNDRGGLKVVPSPTQEEEED